MPTTAYLIHHLSSLISSISIVIAFSLDNITRFTRRSYCSILRKFFLLSPPTLMFYLCYFFQPVSGLLFLSSYSLGSRTYQSPPTYIKSFSDFMTEIPCYITALPIRTTPTHKYICSQAWLEDMNICPNEQRWAENFLSISCLEVISTYCW